MPYFAITVLSLAQTEANIAMLFSTIATTNSGDHRLRCFRATQRVPEPFVARPNDSSLCWMSGALRSSPTCPYWKSNPDVLIVQTSEVWGGHDKLTRRGALLQHCFDVA
jgi:hypothetical protein